MGRNAILTLPSHEERVLPTFSKDTAIATAFSLLFFYGKRFRNDIYFILNSTCAHLVVDEVRQVVRRDASRLCIGVVVTG